MRINRLALGLAPALLLAGCGDGAEDVTPEEGGGAEGEVLGGSISDDMIALDQLQSQSPPLEEQPTTSASDGGSDPAPASEDASQTEEQAPPQADPEPPSDDEG